MVAREGRWGAEASSPPLVRAGAEAAAMREASRVAVALMAAVAGAPERMQARTAGR